MRENVFCLKAGTNKKGVPCFYIKKTKPVFVDRNTKTGFKEEDIVVGKTYIISIIKEFPKFCICNVISIAKTEEEDIEWLKENAKIFSHSFPKNAQIPIAQLELDNGNYVYCDEESSRNVRIPVKTVIEL